MAPANASGRENTPAADRTLLSIGVGEIAVRRARTNEEQLGTVVRADHLGLEGPQAQSRVISLGASACRSDKQRQESYANQLLQPELRFEFIA